MTSMNEATSNKSLAVTSFPATNTVDHLGEWNDGNAKELSDSELSKVICEALFFISGVTVVFFNAILALAIILNKSLHRTMNYYILSLSLSDVLYGFKTIVNYGFLLRKIQLGEDNAEKFTWLNDINSFLFIFCIMNSMLSILALTVQRYRAIVQYMKQPFSKKSTTWTIFFIWIFSMTFSVSYTICIRISLEKYIDWDSIWRRWSFVRVMDFVFFIVAYLIPVVFISVLFFITARSLHQTEIIDHFSTKSLTKKKKALKMILTVFVLFLLTWSPYFFMVFYMNVTLSTASDNSFETEFYVSFLVGLSYSWINVVVYLYFSRELRTAVANVLRCRFSCGKRANINTLPQEHHLDSTSSNLHGGKIFANLGSHTTSTEPAAERHTETTGYKTHV